MFRLRCLTNAPEKLPHQRGVINELQGTTILVDSGPEIIRNASEHIISMDKFEVSRNMTAHA
jgi:hypothetical protein